MQAQPINVEDATSNLQRVSISEKVGAASPHSLSFKMVLQARSETCCRWSPKNMLQIAVRIFALFLPVAISWCSRESKIDCTKKKN